MSQPISKDAVPPSASQRRRRGPRPFVSAFLGSRARLDRRRVRRYRHEPALRAPDRARPIQGRRARAGRSDRRRLAHHLGAADRRHRKIRAVPDAGRQQGRRRHPFAQGARAARARAEDDAGVFPRRRRVGPVLRRRDDHAGDFRSFRARRPEAGRRRPCAVCSAGDDRHPCPAFRRPEPGDGQGRGLLRPDHGGLLRCQRRARRLCISPRPGASWRP